jgi:hypothetical protein
MRKKLLLISICLAALTVVHLPGRIKNKSTDLDKEPLNPEAPLSISS